VKQTNQEDSLVKLFANFIADPSAIHADDANTLENALEKFPFCQILNLFYSRSLSIANSDLVEQQIDKTALLIPERKILYTILKEPENLRIHEGMKPSESVRSEEQISEEPERNPSENIHQFSEESLIDIPQIIDTDDTGRTENHSDSDSETIAQNEAPEEKVDLQLIGNEPEPWLEEMDTTPENKEEKSNEGRLLSEGDVEEIIANPSQSATNLNSKETVETSLLENDFQTINENLPLEELEFMMEIEPSMQSKNVEEFSETEKSTAEDPPVTSPVATSTEAVSEPRNMDLESEQKISKYDDDKMPYSFLWWLSKTRMEHANTYQPYVDFRLDVSQSIKKSSVDQLNSQIIENIFHLQSPLEQVENGPKTVPFQIKRKEDSILEKFIKEEPQIKPPNSQKLDTENKARKSAEDANDLVSETLAHIYADQMLYEKAIATYKKLSLKVPEKSTYFADRILELEKKVN